MVQCSCGKTIEKVPEWLSSAKVEFVCNNCPNRTTKNIAFVSLETAASPEKPDEEGMDLGPEEDEEE